LGTIDDDEELAKHWFVEVEKVFSAQWQTVDFISGRCYPRFEIDPPEWLPSGYGGVIGKIDAGDKELFFGKDFDGVLSGGNSVIKMSVFHEIGLYNEDLGRTEKGLLTCDDHEMHYRLLKANKRGLYSPRLLVYHFVPAARLTKKYYRKWCYGWGMSTALMEKTIEIYTGPTIFGVPRYYFGMAIRDWVNFAKKVFLYLDFNSAFQYQLSTIFILGYIRSKYLKSLHVR
jgi:hypothetical protein